jgi:hypothetical protein
MAHAHDRIRGLRATRDEMDDLREYKTVQNWLEEPPGRGFQPVKDDPERKLDILSRFLDQIGVDPDTLIATSTDLVPTGQKVRNGHLKTLKVWVATLGLSETQATKTENVVRGFFIKNGIKVMTKPYSDVYRKGPGSAGRTAI